MELVVADIGGTHARFALAQVDHGRVVALAEPVTLQTAEHAGLAAAWAAFGAHVGRPLPRAASLAVAGPVDAERIVFTNSAWVIEQDRLSTQLALDHCLLLNDFGAVAHAAVQLSDDHLVHLCGPRQSLPSTGIVTVCGPGTGFGAAAVQRAPAGDAVIETEGGHIGFAPLDSLEDAIAGALRAAFGRVSVERVVSGAGIAPIYRAVAAAAAQPAVLGDERSIWRTALDDRDPLAIAARDHFLAALGSAAGDLALAHGAHAVVIAGGLSHRLRDHFAGSPFATRFTAKGRFAARMEALPVKLIVHPQPGLFGAAAAFAQRPEAAT